MGARNRFSGLYADKTQQAAARNQSPKEKSEVEIMRSQIQKTIRDNPEMAKKAAMIIEQMLEKTKNK
jgi:hypothetical protein